MGKSFSITKYLKNRWNEYEEKKRKREPKWFYYGIYEDGYVPSTKEWLKRGTANALIFLLIVLYTIVIAIIGIRTYVFDVVKIISNILDMQEIIWLLYGVVFGIAGSLIFGSIGNPNNSVHTRLTTSLVYIAYYSFFFIILNIVCIIIVTLWI